ncbi:TatD family hydrolase [Acidobacteriota bacterium]
MNYLVDSHAHLSGEQFEKDRDQVIQKAFAKGIAAILCPGEITESQNLNTTLHISEKYHRIIAAGGAHPHQAKDFTLDCLSKIQELAQSQKIHAVGEIGLDYHYNFSPPEIQRDVFRQQLKIAQKLGFPVVIHSRNARDDVMAAVEAENFSRGGILHCFTEDWAFAKHMIDRGFLISFSGILTFPNADELREVAVQVPLEKLLIETDSPYLVPAPYRGSIKRNEPIHVREVAYRLADLKKVSFEHIAEATTHNFESLFHIAI